MSWRAKSIHPAGTGPAVSAQRIDFGLSGGYVGDHLSVARSWGKALFLSGFDVFAGGTTLSGSGHPDGPDLRALSGLGVTTQARLNLVTLVPSPYFIASLQAVAGVSYIPHATNVPTTGGSSKPVGMLMPTVGGAITVALGDPAGPGLLAEAPARASDDPPAAGPEGATPKPSLPQRPRIGYEFRPLASLGWAQPSYTNVTGPLNVSLPGTTSAEVGGAIGLTVAAGEGHGVASAAAEVVDAVLLHYDSDFDRIAAVTGQATKWIVPRGTAG